jgi:hypothetical protein
LETLETEMTGSAFGGGFGMSGLPPFLAARR